VAGRSESARGVNCTVTGPGELRDEAALHSDSLLGAPITAEILEASNLSRLAAASDRTRASQDRRAGADERTMAHRDRGVAGADRRAGAGERAESHLDRAVALADRRAGAGERGEAEVDRAVAQSDRGAGARERSEAGSDRETALADRGASAVDRESSSHDALTGAYLRGAGLAELDREIARARRDDQPLVLAFLDVDGLKAANDTHGHMGGDRMLRAVADALRANLRAHDLVIRYGGDEFVCVVAGLRAPEAAARIALVNATLGRLAERASVTVGLAELRPRDSAEDLLARADEALYARRQRMAHRR